jgi:hypothetical protein
MSYSDNAGDFFILGAKLDGSADVNKAIDIGAASGTHGEIYCKKPCKVKRVGFLLNEELAGGTSAAPTVVFRKRPTPLSSSGDSAVATLTVPDATAVGKVVYKDFSPVAFAVGDAINITWTVGTGTPTGIGRWFLEADDDPETPANNSDMVASA